MTGSYKIQPLFFLIVLPFSYSFAFLSFIHVFEGDSGNILLNFLPIIPILIAIEYATTPVRKDINTFFKKHGLERSIHDYEFLKNMIFVLTPLTVIIFTITHIWFQQKLDWENYFISSEYFFNGFSAGLTVSLWTTTARLGIQIIKYRFRFYFAKICLKVCSEKKNELEQIKLAIIGINSYKKHLKHVCKLELKSDMIYSTLVTDNEDTRNHKIKLLSKSFEENNDLSPLRHLRNIFKLSSQEAYVTKSKATNDIKEWIPYIVAGITGLPGFLQIINLI